MNIKEIYVWLKENNYKFTIEKDIDSEVIILTSEDVGI